MPIYSIIPYHVYHRFLCVFAYRKKEASSKRVILNCSVSGQGIVEVLNVPPKLHDVSSI